MTSASFVRRITLSTAVLMLAAVSMSRAQEPAPGQVTRGPVRFTTTFPFVAGNATLPAGAYELRQDPDDSGVLEVSADGKAVSALVAVEDATETKATPAPEVIFDRIGDRYVLKSVWLAGSTEGVQTLVTEAERHNVKNGGARSKVRISATRAPKTTAKPSH